MPQRTQSHREQRCRSSSVTLCSLWQDRKSTRLNSSHTVISYAVFCLKKKKTNTSHVHGRMGQEAHGHTVLDGLSRLLSVNLHRITGRGRSLAVRDRRRVSPYCIRLEC